MIEKIIEKLSAESEKWLNVWNDASKEGIIDNYADGMNDAFDEAISIVQEVAKDGGWIPVETELPNNYEFVYATCISLVDNRKPWVIECGYYSELGGFKTATPMIACGDAKVIAWMPRKFPAPYQKGE
jgi:hypothetical protein